MAGADWRDMKDDCIFCKLANGVFPTNSIYEDDTFKVILDASPATKGHALILPKNHATNIYELDDETLSKAMVLAKKIAVKMNDVLKCDGVNVVQNNGEVAGQSVMHYHLHVIPRYKNDKQSITWNPTQPSDEDQKTVCELLKM